MTNQMQFFKTWYSRKDGGYLAEHPDWHMQDSPWKAGQILRMIHKHQLKPRSVGEIGCGAGEILNQLYKRLDSEQQIDFRGYDISVQANALNRTKEKDGLAFYYMEDLEKQQAHFDLLLMIDVVEHVEDCFGFVREHAQRAPYKIYHFPLEVSVLSVLRNQFLQARKRVGHIHFFNKDNALALLKDTGQEVLDHYYTFSALQNRRRLRTRLLNIIRLLAFKVSPDWAVRIFGGFSLIVLTKS